jgi:hypothetical protein
VAATACPGTTLEKWNSRASEQTERKQSKEGPQMEVPMFPATESVNPFIPDRLECRSRSLEAAAIQCGRQIVTELNKRPDAVWWP